MSADIITADSVATPRLSAPHGGAAQQAELRKGLNAVTADLISTVHSNHFPRLSNLSITVLYWGEPSYAGSAPEPPGPAVFAHFPNTLKDLRLHGHPVPWTTPESFGLLTT